MLTYTRINMNKHLYNIPVQLSAYLPAYAPVYTPANKVYKFIQY